MTVIDRILKRDCRGKAPKWWQWFIPRYGNWGGPGWSAGCWNPAKTDWEHPVVGGIGGMDWAMREHDYIYQRNGDLDWADRQLVEDLLRASVTGAYARAYRVGAMVCFSVWPRVRWVCRRLFPWRNRDA